MNKHFIGYSLESYWPTEILRTAKTTRPGARDPTGASNQQTHNDTSRARNDLLSRPPTRPANQWSVIWRESEREFYKLSRSGRGLYPSLNTSDHVTIPTFGISERIAHKGICNFSNTMIGKGIRVLHRTRMTNCQTRRCIRSSRFSFQCIFSTIWRVTDSSEWTVIHHAWLIFIIRIQPIVVSI